MRNFSELFESNKKANLAIFISVFMALAYKGWKWYLRNKMGLDPSLDYLTYEVYSTGFRYFGAFVCLVSAYFLHVSKDNLLKGQGMFFYLPLILFPIGYLVIKSQILDFSFSSIRFLQELPINLAVGFWEEGAFRALLFAGLCRHMKVSFALIVSGVLFSAWHFDVYSNLWAFVEIFLISSCYTLIYVLGASVLQLSLLHFVWDQIHFGLVWGHGTQGHVIHFYELVVLLVLSFIFYFKSRSFKGAKHLREIS